MFMERLPAFHVLMEAHSVVGQSCVAVCVVEWQVWRVGVGIAVCVVEWQIWRVAGCSVGVAVRGYTDTQIQTACTVLMYC
jgi:hypothetical protein